MQYSFSELRSKISIIELAIANGYVLNRSKGMKWPVLESNSGDKIIIVNPSSSSNQGYFNPNDDQDKGTLINFVGNRLGDIFPQDHSLSREQNINRVLHQWLNLPFRERLASTKIMSLSRHGEVVEESIFFPAVLKPLKDMNYLKSRGIAESTLKSATFHGKILQCRIGNFCNIAFPYQETIDGKFVGAEVRNHQFKRHLRGSLRTSSVWVSNIPAQVKRLIICESAIDCLSYFQIKGEIEDVYISIGGSITNGQLQSICKMVEQLPKDSTFRVKIAVDYDKMGKEYAKKILDAIPNAIVDYPNGKDYNEELKNGQLLFNQRHL
jgi:hypothetical protein